MQDYSLNDQEANQFIINYEIKDNKIEINYANGDIKEINYSVDNEKRILEEMENQVQNCQQFKSKQEKTLGKYRKKNAKAWFYVELFLFSILGGALGLTLVYSILFMGSTLISIPEILKIIISATSALAAILVPYPLGKAVASKLKINDIEATLEDIEKNELFLENKKKINKNIKKGNCLDNVAQETKEIIIDKENPSLNINDLDKMQLADIENILLNIKRNKLLNLKQENDLVEDNLFTPEELTKDEEYTRTKSLN